MKLISFAVFLLIIARVYSVQAKVDFKEIFKDESGCFIEIDNSTGKSIVEYGKKKCGQRLPPCSTFKIPLVFAAFEENIFSSTADKIMWDKKIRERSALNQDQTPVSWIRDSVVWVSQIVTQKLGDAGMKSYLNKFEYGNQDISGGLDKFWLDSSLLISAKEQTVFLSSVWNRKIAFSDSTFKKAQEVLFSKKLSDGSEVYGKTGSCCIDQGCQDRPGRQLGWFVGVVVSGQKSRSFALNFSDEKAVGGYAGLRAKEKAFSILEKTKNLHY